MIKQFASKQFLLFSLAGGIAALVNFLSRILYSEWMGFATAIMVAYITGMITAFILVRLFVFKNTTQKIHHSMMYFTLVNVVAVAQTLLISLILADYVLPFFQVTSYRLAIAHGIGVLSPVFTSYLGHKHISFR